MQVAVADASAHTADDQASRQGTHAMHLSKFENLPISIRGRVKFEAIEWTFKIINEAFQLRNAKRVRGAPPEPVILKELHEKGATVYGRNGEQTLSSLRSLGLIAVDKRGITVVQPKKAPLQPTN
jgi:hypothetical protein